MKENKFPLGWDVERVQRVIADYDKQTELEAIAEDEAAFEDQLPTVMDAPVELVPSIQELIAKSQINQQSV